MTVPTGKGIYMWNIVNCAGGNPALIVELAKDAGLAHVSIKGQDGIAAFTKNNQQERMAELVPGLKEAGIEVWIWGYLYGNRWYRSDGAQREAAATLEQLDRWKPKGFHIDAENEYQGQPAAADTWLNGVTAGAPGVALGLSSYRFPRYFPTFPWQQFARRCTHHYPQLYWEQAHNPGAQLRASALELKAIRNLPIVPVGSAYQRGSWAPTVADLQEFHNTAKELEMPGISFWSWEHAQQRADWWDTIAEMSWPAPAPDPEPEPGALTLEERIARLEDKVFGPGA